MSCRRKLKKERELVADINKTFQHFCQQRECRDCPYRYTREYSTNCTVNYVIDLLQKYTKSEEEE